MSVSLRYRGLIAAAAVALVMFPSASHAAGGFSLLGSGSNYLDLGVGTLNIEGATSAGGRVEVRLGEKLWKIGPALGCLADGDGELFGYGGVYVDIAYRRLVLTPLLAAGIYNKGDGKDLGGPFEFREALTLAWQFHNGLRIGIQVAHISNAHIYPQNPGQQDVLLTVAAPF
jgi:hypothetical protein